ncbi:MAG TPA: Ig domain-containing protein [Verrucomicrobiae bacterium]|nr:Ig domain-containing protein [Verrucomicrobiae bacterium]
MKTRISGLFIAISLVFVFPLMVIAAGTLSIGQTFVNLNVGQTMSISYSPPFGQTANIFYNSNTSVVSASVASNNTVILSGLNSGNAEVRLCTSDLTCGTISVNVGSGGLGPVSVNPNNLTMNVGEVRNVSLFSNSGQSFFIGHNSNSNIASGSIVGNNMEIRAFTSGSTVIRVCSGSSNNCADLFVNVTGTSNITFSQNNLNLAVGHSAVVNIFGGSNGYYIQNNSNPSALSAYISSSNLNLLALTHGASQITVCNFGNNSCGIVHVTTDIGSFPQFVTFNLPQPTVGNFYSHQIQVTGGSLPYHFQLNSGSLPSGLNLSGSGIISGTPSNDTPHNFTVRVFDSQGRNVTSGNLFLKATGSVLGTNIYPNGTLINDGGTIYTTYKNTKSGFANMSAFTGLGYRLSNVISASTHNLTNNGFTVNSSNIAHPWGTWIKSGSTIYFVHENGLIPISHYDVFVSNQGRDAMVVPANSFDFNKPILSVMTYSDLRLR